MKRTTIIHLFALLTSIAVAGDQLVVAQRDQSDLTALRTSIERRFEVLQIRDGVVLKPRDSSGGVRSIEVTNDLIAIDGQPATGPELRQKLGADDADLVRQFSYLSPDQQHDLFSATRDTSTPSVMPPVAPTSPSPVPFSRLERRTRGRRAGDRVQFGSNVTIRDDEVVDGDVVAIGGNVIVDGEVRGDVVGIGGVVTLGPKSQVANNVVVVGGPLRRDPGSRIGGRVQTVGVGSLNFGDMRWTGNPLRLFWGSMVGAAFALVFTLTRLAILCLLAALVVLFGRGYMERTADRVASDTVKAGAIGLLSQLLFLPVLVMTIVVLVMTIIGIPLLLLLPFVFLGLAIVAVVGFTAVGYRLGALLMARLGRPSDNPYMTTIAGIMLVLSPLLLARLLGLLLPFTFGLGLIGMLLEYAAWTVGFGAVALTRFGRQNVTTVATTTAASV
jgi:hypothetical protein